MKYYTEKQSYWGGYFFGKVACMDLTKNARVIDGWDGFPKGFNWKEYKRGFISGWNEGKLLHQSKKQGTLLDSSTVLNSEFANKMYNAVEDAVKSF